MVDYKFSFTAASALVNETITIARVQLQLNDWNKTKVEVLENNLMQKAKASSAKRQYVEIEKRLKLLNNEQLDLLCNGNMDEAKAIIWLAIVKAYVFVSDFAKEVMFVNYVNREYILSDLYYWQFWEYKSNTHSECIDISEATQRKVKQVLFNILCQLGFITSISERRIITPLFSKNVEMVIAQDNPRLLTLFLYENFQVKQILENL